MQCNNEMWLDSDEPARMIIRAVLASLVLAVLVFFAATCAVKPGYVPLCWAPEEAEVRSILQFCDICKGFKAPRSHHCRICNRCVIKMDHHCPWINNCVGHRNHAFFVWFLMFSVLGSAVCYFVTGCYLHIINQGREGNIESLSFGLLQWIIGDFSSRLRSKLKDTQDGSAMTVHFLSMGVIPPLCLLLFNQVLLIATNLSGVDYQIIKSVRNMRRQRVLQQRSLLLIRQKAGEDVRAQLSSLRVENFENPYSLGLLTNLSLLLPPYCFLTGDYMQWSVRPGCDLYTLQREYASMRKSYRESLSECTVVEDFSGSFLPLYSGVSSLFCVSFFCASRLKVKKGDKILADIPLKNTVSSRCWLYGETISVDCNHQHARGWLPRRCVIQHVHKKYV